ncbi:hypothetical protein RND81_08G136900 [Saponaria officinalis]|uniref:Uncharacterized protein n=1 Tax=Saponaria officinalis TaxID=3572 RepID=A0AAW1J7M2_SAPOF
MSKSLGIKYISQCYIKPKYEANDSKKPYLLTHWDLVLLSINYTQRGLLFPLPKQDDFSIDTLLQSLKDSLAETLALFYPLAGQLVTTVFEDEHRCTVHLDCNKGQGARFIHASLDNVTVSDILCSVRYPSVVHSLFDLSHGEVSYDGHTMPNLSIHLLPHNPLQLTEKLFRFRLKEIQKLKSKANEDIHDPNNKISSFQAVAAFIWRCIIRASNLTPEKATHCKLTANNRSRVSPPLPPSYFGNSVSVILTSTTAGELLESSLGQVGELLNKSVQNHTSEVINDIALKLFESPYVIRRGTLVDSGVNDTVLIVSSPRLDMYGNEFIGLGKPISVRSGFGNKVPGLVTAYAGNQGPGSMDFDICLTADCMKNLESDVEFMDFASSYESL